MRVKIFSVLSLVSVLVLSGCSNDIILPPAPTLAGDYVGTYKFVSNLGAANEETHTQPILWEFTDSKFLMEIDTASPNFGNHSFCKVSGNYAQTTGVRLQVLTSIPLSGKFTSCNADQNPEGTFAFIRANDTIRLSLSQTTSLIEVILTRAN